MAVGLLFGRFLVVFIFFQIFLYVLGVYGPISKILLVKDIQFQFLVVLLKHGGRTAFNKVFGYFFIFYLLVMYVFPSIFFCASLLMDVVILVFLY